MKIIYLIPLLLIIFIPVHAISITSMKHMEKSVCNTVSYPNTQWHAVNFTLPNGNHTIYAYQLSIGIASGQQIEANAWWKYLYNNTFNLVVPLFQRDIHAIDNGGMQTTTWFQYPITVSNGTLMQMGSYAAPVNSQFNYSTSKYTNPTGPIFQCAALDIIYQ